MTSKLQRRIDDAIRRVELAETRHEVVRAMNDLAGYRKHQAKVLAAS